MKGESKLEGKRFWERFDTAMLDWGGYVLLAAATVLALFAGVRDGAWLATTLGLVAAAAAWIYVLYTRMYGRRKPLVRIIVFYSGLLVIASLLMLQQPLYFIFMISGFLYATILTPVAVTVAGVFVTSILVNSLIAGLPRTADGWLFYLVIIALQTVAIGAGVVVSQRLAQQSEERRDALARLEAATVENAGLHAQLVTQAREAGVLDERARMASEIHDTIAQGLIGIVTQLEAARQAGDRAEDRDRHIDNAQRLARDSLTEARRSVEGAMPTALESATLPDALAALAADWSSLNGVPVDVKVTGPVVALTPDIEVALLRTAQEALANVARHAGASRAGLTLSYMDDVVTLDVRDDGVGFTVPEAGTTPGSGFGLTAMRRRVARVAGSLAIESEPGGGTALSARVPAITKP